MGKAKPEREFDLEDWDEEQALKQRIVIDPEDDEDEETPSFAVEVREVATKYVTVFAEDAADALAMAETDLKRYDFAGSADKTEQEVVGIVVGPGKTVKKGAAGLWEPVPRRIETVDLIFLRCPACGGTTRVVSPDELRKPGPLACPECGSENYFMHQDWMDGTEYAAGEWGELHEPGGGTEDGE